MSITEFEGIVKEMLGKDGYDVLTKDIIEYEIDKHLSKYYGYSNYNTFPDVYKAWEFFKLIIVLGEFTVFAEKLQSQ